MSDDLEFEGKSAEELLDLYFGFTDDETGEIPEEDTQKAFAYLKAASDKGLPEAWAELGACYLAGLGVESDEKEASKLLENAALKDIANAQMNLYILMRDKAQTDEEKKDALFWLEKAAQNNVPSALYETGSLYYNGIIHEKNYKKAFEYFSKAADADYGEGYASLGVMYQMGEGIAQDQTKAVQCFAKAADLGSITGLFNLGSAYMGGLGIGQDYEKAAGCFVNIVDLEEPFFLTADLQDKKNRSDIAQVFHRIQIYNMIYPMAHHNIAVMYQQGLGCEADPVQALYHFMLGAESGYAQSCLQAGTMLYSGEGHTEEIKAKEEETLQRAFGYLSAALEAGLEEAKLGLSMMYYCGEGVEEDKPKAAAMIDSLIAAGNVSAIKIKNSLMAGE